MGSKVYVLRETRVGTQDRVMDYSPAERFGEIIFVTRQEPSGARNSFVDVEIVAALTHAAQRYDPQCDYIVCSGSPAVIFLAGLVFAEYHDRVQLLRWRGDQREYTPIVWNIAALATSAAELALIRPVKLSDGV